MDLGQEKGQEKLVAGRDIFNTVPIGSHNVQNN